MNAEIGSCLAVGWNGAGHESIAFPLLLVVGFFAAIVAAPLVLMRYQRRVERLMSVTGVDGEDEPEHRTPAPTRAQPSPLSAAELVAAIATRMGTARNVLWAAVGVFVLASAAVITVSSMFLEGLDLRSVADWADSLFEGLVLACCAAAPIAMLAAKSRLWRAALLLPFGVLVLGVLWEVGSTAETPPTEEILDVVFGLAALALIYLALAGRRLRNVVPLLTLLASIWIGAFYLVAVLSETLEPCELPYAEWIDLAGGVLGIWGSIWLGMRLVHRLTGAYERQAFSDSQLQVGLWFLVMVILLGVVTTPDDDDVAFSAWSLGIAAAGLAALAVYLRQLRLVSPWSSPQPLLLLRVFSSRRATQQLLDDVSHRWAFVGPILLVGGPDLAKTYLEPHELLLFLRRRLAQHFVRSREELTQRLADVREAPDPDGRHRVNEFFCAGDRWQPAVRRLLERARVVLLDLRGFDESRAGTAYELTLLAREDALDRTVVLVDRDTNAAAISAALREVPGATLAAERVLDLDAAPDVERVVRLLADVTTGEGDAIAR